MYEVHIIRAQDWDDSRKKKIWVKEVETVAFSSKKRCETLIFTLA